MQTCIRPLVVTDVDVICEHRRRMFAEAGRDADALQRMAEPFRGWLQERLASGAYGGWIVEIEGRPVAGVGLMFIDWPPHPDHPEQDRRGYVLNLYVEPEHRGKGLAKALMARIEAEAAARGVDHLILHATPRARPLYEQLNWRGTSEMSRNLAAA